MSLKQVWQRLPLVVKHRKAQPNDMRTLKWKKVETLNLNQGSDLLECKSNEAKSIRFQHEAPSKRSEAHGEYAHSIGHVQYILLTTTIQKGSRLQNRFLVNSIETLYPNIPASHPTGSPQSWSRPLFHPQQARWSHCCRSTLLHHLWTHPPLNQTTF